MNLDLRRLLLGTFAGGLLIFLTNSIGWNVLPFTNRAIHDLAAPAVVEPIAAATRAAPGTWFVNPNEHRDGLGAGPVYGWMTVFPRESYSVPRMLAGSLVHNFATAFAMAVVLMLCRGTRRERLVVGSSIAGIATLVGPVWEWLWAFYSPAFAMAVGLNTLVAHGVAAAVLVKLTALPTHVGRATAS